MRPTRLCVEGFTVFRRPTEIDFGDADLFALTGPTGSGKSSLIDAMVFALYGTVPRHDRRAVAPVISVGALEAKVRLDFTVGGRAYVAVRVVRRTKTGATTKEARLERADGEVLAGTAEELTEQVSALLGLGYEHFVKCVVLPQGQFAKFLHDSGADRQGLLVQLLDLGLYERMAGIARDRHAAATEDLRGYEGQLTQLADATPEELASAVERVGSLEALAGKAETWAKELQAHRQGHEAAQRSLEALRAQLQAISTIKPPDGLIVRADALATARAELEEAETGQAAAEEAVETAERALGALPGRSELEQAVRAHSELGGVREQREAQRAAHADATTEAATAGEVLRAAEARRDEAMVAHEAAAWEHRAHDLAATLVVGEPCPVCSQDVESLPAGVGAGAGAVSAAKDQWAQAEAAVKDARSASTDADRRVNDAAQKIATLAERVAALEQQTVAWPDAASAGAILGEIDAAEAEVAHAAKAARLAARSAAAARRAVADITDAAQGDVVALDRARDSVAALQPPPSDRSDPATAWGQLVAWAAEQRPLIEDAATVETGRITKASSAVATLRDEAAESIAAHGLRLAAGADPSGVVLEALGEARARRERLEADLQAVAALRVKAVSAKRSADLAGALARHLSATGFEKWVLDEALVDLCRGATEILRDLSNGAYSLALDDKANFTVIDHRNADEPRSARTLSGGETFLAALALALSLADQVGQLAAHGAARIESIFLDEGFDTLDPDALDTVASAIEELGSSGRMVGLVSHVAALAERVPVRFVVRKDPAGSQVEKVLA